MPSSVDSIATRVIYRVIVPKVRWTAFIGPLLASIIQCDHGPVAERGRIGRCKERRPTGGTLAVTSRFSRGIAIIGIETQVTGSGPEKPTRPTMDQGDFGGIRKLFHGISRGGAHFFRHWTARLRVVRQSGRCDGSKPKGCTHQNWNHPGRPTIRKHQRISLSFVGQKVVAAIKAILCCRIPPDRSCGQSCCYLWAP